MSRETAGFYICGKTSETRADHRTTDGPGPSSCQRGGKSADCYPFIKRKWSNGQNYTLVREQKQGCEIETRVFASQ